MAVIKRDGTLVPFNLVKITDAITKAFEATRNYSVEDVVNLLALKAVSKLDMSRDVKVEEIQDAVEEALSEAGFHDVAKSYIIYRQSHSDNRDGKTVVNYKKVVEGYVDDIDWRVKENSTVSYSLGGLILNASGAVTANYWLSEIYDKEIAEAHRNGDMHIHDLSMLSGYCAGWSLKQLITEGIHGVAGRVSAAPARHLSTLCNQMVNFLGIMQNEWAGAQAFSSFDTYLSAFVKKDDLSFKEVKQALQNFIFGVNTPSRWGCVPETYKVMTTEGWKGIDELKVGDMLYTWKNGKLSKAVNNNVIIKDHDGSLISFRNDHYGYEQTVTGYHRTLVCSDSEGSAPVIMQAEDLKDKAFNEKKTEFYLPKKVVDSDINDGIDLTDNEIWSAAGLYAFLNETMDSFCFFEGDVDYEKVAEIVKDYKNKDLIDEKFMHMSSEQAKVFLYAWAYHSGSNITSGESMTIKAQPKNPKVREQLAFISALAGNCIGNQNKASKKMELYYDKATAIPFDITEVPYKGRVWCPNNDDGTAIFMNDKGGVFISGQCQAPFSNITLDWTVPEDLKNLPAIVGGKEQDFTYGDCQLEMDMVNKAFLELMIAGDCNGTGFQYPIPTYSITPDFNWGDTENNRLLFEMTAKYGTPYFSNYLNSDMKPSDIRSMCCRLRLDLRELRRKNGGFFGSGESTGSVGVVTLNMPRLGYLSTSKEDFYNRLDHLMDIAARSLRLKREKITDYLERGLYPYTKQYLGSFQNHFSTIGLVGMNEACLNAKWLAKDLTNKEAQDFTAEVLDHMRNRLSDYQEKYAPDLYNLEATPAESTCYRLAMHDKKMYPDIITAGEGENIYYTNSSNLPVGYTDDIFTALDVQDNLQTKYTSGTVFHMFLGERVPTWQGAMNLVKKVCENYRLPYITISPTYSICPDHGYITGEHFTCPKCGKETQVWSRITGYFRPIQNWNKGKKAEYFRRKEYENYGKTNIFPSIINNTSKSENSQEVEKKSEKSQVECENCKLDNSVGKTNTVGSKTENIKSDGIILFTTKTCPNCPRVKKALADNGIEYEMLDAEENAESCEKLGIKSVPSLVADGKVITGVGPIMGWIKESRS